MNAAEVRHTATRYIFATTAIGAVLLVRLAIDPVVGEQVAYAPFFAAIAAVVWFTRSIRASLYTVVLGYLAASWFFVSPRHSFGFDDPATRMATATYFMVAFAFVAFGQALQRSRHRFEKLSSERNEDRERLRVTLASIGDGVIACDPRGNVTYLNAVAEALTGWTGGEAFGQPLMEVFPIVNEHTRAAVPNPIARAFQTGSPVNLPPDTLLVAQDGTERPIDDNVAPIRDASGNITGAVLIFRDVSARRAAEAALQETREEQRALTAQVRDFAIFTTDTMGRPTTWNEGVERVLGFGEAEFIGHDVSNLIFTPEDIAAGIPQRELATAVRDGTAGNDRWMRRKDGERFFAEGSTNAIKDRVGKLRGFTKVMRDSTHVQQAEQRARELQDRLQTALSISTVGVLFFNLNGRILDANATFERLSGYTADELRGATHWRQLTAAEFIEPTLRSAQNLAERGVTPPYEKIMIRKDGSRWWGLFAPTRLSGSGTDSECIEFIIDISERKAAEAALRESEERFRRLFESAPVAVLVCDQHGMIRDYNRLTAELWGREPARRAEWDFGTAELWQLDGTRLPAAQNPILEVLRTGIPASSQLMIQRPDGERVPVAMNVAALRGAAGDITGAIASFVDITERLRAEELLRSEAGRLEALVQQRTAKLQEVIGELEAFSYSMAHDLRGPLRSLTGLTGLLREEHYAQLDEMGRHYVDRIGAAASRMHALIRDVLTYSQLSREALPLKPVALEPLLQSVRDQYLHLSEPRIHIAHPLPVVLGHEAALTQVFSNLLSNAAKFVPTDRKPEIEVATIDPPGSNDGAGQVTIVIRDNGIGIAPENLERIFHMFERLHSDKEYEGTGIGLAIVRRVVERMGGSVGVESVLGKGSRFWVKLRKA